MKLTTKEYFTIRQEADNLLEEASTLEKMARNKRRRALSLLKVVHKWEDTTYYRINKLVR